VDAKHDRRSWFGYSDELLEFPKGISGVMEHPVTMDKIEEVVLKWKLQNGSGRNLKTIPIFAIPSLRVCETVFPDIDCPD